MKRSFNEKYCLSANMTDFILMQHMVTETEKSTQELHCGVCCVKNCNIMKTALLW